MKNKKFLWLILSIGFIGFIAFSVLFYRFKPLTMKEVYKQPNFIGEVLEVYEGSILVAVDEAEEEFKSSDKINVSLGVKVKDNATSLNIEANKVKVGDKVRVFYDGTILETYPAKLNTVYAILLIES